MPPKASTKTSGKPAAKRASARASAGLGALPRADVPLVGRDEERARIGRAIARGVFPQAVLVTGARGVGKRRLAGWMAQALVCAAPTADGAPCDRCTTCRLARGLTHPDIHWYQPHASPGGGPLEQQLEAVDAMRAEQLTAMRADALWPGAEPGALYYLATIQAMRRQAIRTASLGGRKVFLLADADRLLAQIDAAGEAANALLKLLEEPPPGTHFLLTSSRPHQLPATVRSRTTTLPLRRLTADTLREILLTAAPTLAFEPPERLERLVAVGHGAVTDALAWEAPEWQATRTKSLELLSAVLRQDAVARYTAVKAQGFADARGAFSTLLVDLEALCVQGAALAAGVDSTVAGVDPRLVTSVDALAVDRRPTVAGWTRAAATATAGYLQAQGNANPQLVLHTVLVTMGAVLAASTAPAAR